MMKFVEYRQKERSTYVRNETYWKPNRPYLDGMQYTMITDSQTALRSVMAGENDFIYALTPQQLDTAKQSGMKGAISPALASQIIYFNWGRGPLADLRVRQAVNFGIDCAAFNKVINKGKFEIADEMLPKEHWAYDKGLAGWHPYNPGKAKQLLKEAGMADGVELAIYAQADQLSQQRVEVLSEQLKKAGIRLKVTTGQIPELAKSFFADKQGDALLAGWTGRPDPSLTYALMFGKSSFFNPGGQETPGLEDALAETRATSDLEARKQAFAKVQKIVIDHALWAPIVFLEQVVAYNPKIRGYRPTLLGKPRFDDVSIGA
jgi:peptide/nickel transport system permease protein/peptide/nickel transport system substrate-binding protein